MKTGVDERELRRSSSSVQQAQLARDNGRGGELKTWNRKQRRARAAKARKEGKKS